MVIAHRLTTIAKASRILVFENGSLIEQGSHEELMDMEGRYTALYNIYYSHQDTGEISEKAVKMAQKEMKKVESMSDKKKMGGKGKGAMKGAGKGHGMGR